MNMDCRFNVLSENYYDFIIDHDVVSDGKSFVGCFNNIDSTYTSIYIPVEQTAPNPIQAYGYNVLVRLFGLLDIASLEKSGVSKLQHIPSLNLTGQGVLIGIVDTGIDFTHKTFQHADGTTKIVSIWDQTIQTGTPPDGFIYGTEYTMEQINVALDNVDPRAIVPSFDEIGHGTFLAGIASGNSDPSNNFSGVVPDSEIVVVKLKPAKNNLRNYYFVREDINCYQENDIMLGVRYLLDTALRLNRPLSICIGLGTNQGGHDDQGALSNYLSTISRMDGIAVCIAAGNEGNNRHHYNGYLKYGTPFDLVEINVGPNERGFTMEIWGDPPAVFPIDLLTPSGEYVSIITPRFKESRKIGFIFEKTVVHIDFQIVGSSSGAQLTMIRFDKPTEGIWRLKVYQDGSGLDLSYNIWLPMNGFISNETYFIRSFPNITVTSPGNTTSPIVVTAYDQQNNSLYLNASRGFTREGHITPSIAAPGVNIIGPTLDNGYTTMSGTSVAAAHATGVAAILLEWGIVNGNLPFLDGIDIKNLLLRGANRGHNSTYPNREWGYGTLNIYMAFESLRGSI
ncbi:MAG: S8 family peptidase [Mobilitalea sp.]